MVVIPILSLFFLTSYSINRRQKIKQIFRLRTKYALIGLILGPIIGCGIIANLYFKDTWGRARPVHIEEFGGDKIFTPPFSNQINVTKIVHGLVERPRLLFHL